MGIMLASALTGSATGGTVITVLYIVAIVAFLYFIMIRPQRKEQSRIKDMLSSLEVGDSVCTTGGFYGIVVDVEEDTVIVEFGNKNCRIPMKKEAIAQIEKPEETSETTDKKKN